MQGVLRWEENYGDQPAKRAVPAPVAFPPMGERRKSILSIRDSMFSNVVFQEFLYTGNAAFFPSP